MDILGYRAKLGIIVASTNTVTAPDTIPLCPPGTSLHFSDYLSGDDVFDSATDLSRPPPSFLAALTDARKRMQSRKPTIVGLFLDEEIAGGLRLADGGFPAVLPSEALAAAAEKTGWTKAVGVLSPFLPEDHKRAVARLKALGYEVVVDVALAFDRPMASAETSFVALREAHQSLIEHGAAHIVQLGHNLPYAKLVSNLEEDFAPPILAINQVCLWYMLRRAWIEDLVPYAGKLFLDY